MRTGWTRHLPTLAVLVALPLLLTWPLSVSGARLVLAAPDQEAATHIWGLWAAIREGQVPVVHTRLLGWPEGVELVLVDPANLPAFGLGHLLGGVVLGYNLTVWWGLVVMGLGGALLAGRAGGAPWLGAAVAMASPTLLANTADGMTEGMGVGWTAVQLGLLLTYLSRRRWPWGVAAALALATAWYAGPYNGLFAALLDAGVAGAALARRQWGAVGRAAWVAALATLLALPGALAVSGQRAAHLPGSAERAGLPPVVENPAIFRGGVQTGADLLDPWLPGPLTGAEAPVSHTAYLGVVLLGVALLAVRRDRRRWPWLAGALGFAMLSFGPHLYLAGRALRVGDQPLLAPAGWLMVALPGLFGRITRWYRAGAVATLLLAPLAAAATRQPRARLAVAALVVADSLLCAPLAWPLHATAPPATAPYAVLEGEGALLEIPPATTGQPPPGHWRDRVGLTQPFHGRPVQGGIMGLGRGTRGTHDWLVVENLLRTGALSAADAQRLQRDGFRWLAIYPPYRSMPAESRAVLEACLGPPRYADDEVWLFDIVPPRLPCGNSLDPEGSEGVGTGSE